MILSILGCAFALLAACIHIYIFFLESVWWNSKKVNKIFKMTAAEAKICQGFAFNQGFYNLFLALSVFTGSLLYLTLDPKVGLTLISTACLSMLGAALVLRFSSKSLTRAAIMQGLPPSLALISLTLNFL
ncbi:MAG: DUF1304 domain-containing protein [Bdellovibrionales bacterium]